MESKKKVVVVGGGVAGTAVAYGLQNVADVTLIDPKDYTEVPYADLRCIVEPTFAERSLIKHSEYLKKGKHVQSSAKTATATEVITVSGEEIAYDFLVITTGTTFHVPPGRVTKEERMQEFKELNQQLVEAESVLIIGGGPVGVELVGEIVTDFPQKTVTLVHSGDRVLEFLGPKVSQKTEKWMKKKGVNVILKDRVENFERLSPPTYETAKHVEIKADTHFVAVGKKVAIKWIEETPFLKEQVTVDGRLKVKPTTQVDGHKNVFAAGDVTDFKEMKQGYLANQHAAVVIQNIQKLMKNPDDEKLAVYKVSGSPIGIVSLGRVIAVAQLPFGTILGRMAGMLKSKDLFVGKSREQLGLKAK
ncbi:unnamed protein product [Calypogeia fissa]